MLSRFSHISSSRSLLVVGSTRGFAKAVPKKKKIQQPVYSGIKPVIPREVPSEQWMLDLRKENFFADLLNDPKVELAPDERAAMTRIGSYRNASDRQLFDRRVTDTIKKYQRFPGDTGSTEVQVAVISERINWIRERMMKHRRDTQNRIRLEAYFHQRRKLMKYLKRTRFDMYNVMIVDYGITEEEIWEYGRIAGRRLPEGTRYPGLLEKPVETQKRLLREEEAAKAKAKQEQEALAKKQTAQQA